MGEVWRSGRLERKQRMAVQGRPYFFRESTRSSPPGYGGGFFGGFGLVVIVGLIVCGSSLASRLGDCNI